jgi:hypothetical protein
MNVTDEGPGDKGRVIKTTIPGDYQDAVEKLA